MTKKNNIETYSIHNKGKSTVTERFIRTSKNKICIYINFNIKRCVY